MNIIVRNIYYFNILAFIVCITPTIGGGAVLAEDMPSEWTRRLLPRLFAPIEPAPDLDSAKVALGERLFHDTILSHNRAVSCATCHDIAAGGDDGRPVSMGMAGQPTRRNSPTVLNIGLQRVFFWDGRARSLAQQIESPIVDEMGNTWGIIVGRLLQVDDYVSAFREIYGGALTEKTIKDAIATYEMSLTTPGARFDRFLRNDSDALTAQEKRGLDLFVRLGCGTCHQGTLLGGNMFQRFGVYRDPTTRPGAQPDLGRYEITGNEADKFVFKVPSLRNVVLTGPYFHNGSAPDLETAVRTMALVQLNKNLDDGIVADIVAFLGTLTGEIPSSPHTLEANR
jgi:cytochrome c peroxidase